MKGSLCPDINKSTQKSESKNIPVLLAYVQKPEFQRLRSEFEKILDSYLQNSKQVSDEEIRLLISDTTEDFKQMLKRAAAIMRANEDPTNHNNPIN